MLTTMLFVKELSTMQRFYETVFGLRADANASQRGFVVLVGDGTRLALHELPREVADRIEITAPPRPRDDAAVKLLFSVDDVVATIKTVEQLGGHSFETSTGEGVDAVDPEGNVLRVMRRGADR